MTNQEMLQDVTFRSTRLEVSVALLKADVNELRRRLETPDTTEPVAPRATAASIAAVVPPPIPLPPLPILPSVVAAAGETVMQPQTEAAKINEPAAQLMPTAGPAATTESTPAPAGPGFELQFGRWLARIGVVFALFTLIFFSVLIHHKYYHYLGPWSKLSVLTLVSSALIFTGFRLEKRDSKLLVYGRTLAGGGLACLYYTIYGATYVPQLHVIGSPLFGGFLLLAWSAAVLWLAERRKSELLSVFALSLAYVSSAITPGNGFVMTADLILAATAVIFLVRNSWTGLSYLCLIGTYLGFLRQAVSYKGPLDFDWIGTLPFWPSAVYLTGAWLIFTAGILLSRGSEFIAGKRMAFLCLNNGAWAGLLVVAAELGEYPHLGGIFGTVGAAFLIASAIFRMTHADARDIAGAYLAQGLTFATGGIAIAYSGVTRGLTLTIESVFLVAGGAYSRNLILRLGGGICAVLGALFLADELTVHTLAYPWVLTFGGAFAMLANAWLERSRAVVAAAGPAAGTVTMQPANPATNINEPAAQRAAATIVASSVLYVLLALGLIATGIIWHAPFEWIAPDLAITALILALSIYILPLYELAPLSQLLLILAQLISFGIGWDTTASEASDWFRQPQWSHNIVALVTLLLATWWPRHKQIRTSGWLTPLTSIYALALTAFCYESLHPHLEAQTWMIDAALLSLVFLAYGAWTRLWAFALSGQILLALSVVTFLAYGNDTYFPWTWWAAAIPIAVVFAAGWIARSLLAPALNATTRDVLLISARIYQSIATALLVRWVFGVAPADEINLWLVALGTVFLLCGAALRSSYAIRAGLVLDLAAVVHYFFSDAGAGHYVFTWTNAFAFALLLAQPALLRRWARDLISEAESWAVILISAATMWSFVSTSITAVEPANLTLGWAGVAVGLIIAGFAANERRQRWCGLGILVAAFIRVAVHDVWQWSDAYKVLTFLVLTVICLGLSFLYYKFADRLKEWL